MYSSKELGKRIKLLREAAGLTQERMAMELNIGTNYAGKLECGTRTPSVDLLLQISGFFSVSVDFLLTGKSQPGDGLKKMVRDTIRQLEYLEKQLP